MTIRTGWAAGVLVGFAAGCSDAPKPIQAAKPVDTPVVAAGVKIPKTPAPAKSDPAAAAVVADAIKAHTGGKPERLAGWKTASYRLVGQVLPQAPTSATLDVKMEWPTRFWSKWELDGKTPYILGRNADTGWASEVGTGKSQASPDIAVDSAGEWFGFLGCLTDADTVVAPGPDLPDADRPTVGVRVWSPHLPPAVLHFEKASKRLARVTFLGREDGKEVTKEIVFLPDSTFPTATGVLFPSKRVVRIDGAPTAEWELVSAEIPATLDAKLFEKP